MKIAFLVSTFYPRVGGMGKVVLQEARSLSALGHEVEVLTLDYNDQTNDNFGFIVKRFKPFFKLGDAGVVLNLFWHFKNFDIIHLHYPFFGSDWAVLLAKLFWRKPYVLTYHMDAKSNGFLKNLLQKVYNLFFRKLLFTRADAVAMVDEDYGQFSFSRLALDGKKYVLSNPVDTDVFLQSKEKEVNKKIILFVGNFLPIKRIDLIFQALQKISDLFLVLVGGGYDEYRLKKLADEFKISDRIYWYGYVENDKELARLYSVSNCTIVASDYESFSLVAAESMACGTPVLGSSANGVKQRINSNVDGFIFEKGNADDLIEIIKKFFALSREQRIKMGESGRQKIIKENNIADHIKNLLEIYNVVLK